MNLTTITLSSVAKAYWLLAVSFLLCASNLNPRRAGPTPLLVEASNNNKNSYDGAILVLGDSWASVSGSFLSTVCSIPDADYSSYSSSTSSSYSSSLYPYPYFAVTNNGISGSTASQWASGNYVTKSFNKYDYDYVWLSIGGNDFNCDESYHETIASNIVSVISDIISSSSNENIKILYTGYGYPSSNICGGDDDFLSIFEDFSETVREAIESSDYADMVYTMDVTTLFVTDDSYPLSDTYYYADSIHINENGYVKLFSMDDIQEFFECDDDDDARARSRNYDMTYPSSGWSSNGGTDLANMSSVAVGVIVALALVSLAVFGVYVVNKKKEAERSNIPGLSGTLIESTTIAKQPQEQQEGDSSTSSGRVV